MRVWSSVYTAQGAPISPGTGIVVTICGARTSAYMLSFAFGALSDDAAAPIDPDVGLVDFQPNWRRLNRLRTQCLDASPWRR